jgi:type IV pilus assembly protein PilO
LNELNRKLNRLENMLPDKFFLSGFLQEAEKISKETGVAIIDIRPLNEMQQGDYSELPIEMIIRGSFEEVLDFTKKVENFQRFISISAANISPSSQGQAEKLIPELEGRFLLVIYSSN